MSLSNHNLSVAVAVSLLSVSLLLLWSALFEYGFKDRKLQFKISTTSLLKICKESLISMEIETFDRLRSGLNSFHGELLLF